jgi:hypothetical protein
MPAPKSPKRRPQPYALEAPIVSVWTIEDPTGKEPPKAFIIRPPHAWGPFYTAGEVREALEELRIDS